MPTWLIWLIVIVVVVVVIAAVVLMVRKRRTEQNRARAHELRQEASTHAGTLTESQRNADEARAQAELAKAEAQRAEERAARAQQSHQVDQAEYEDKLRTADKLDPGVNTRAQDYEPDVWNDERSGSAAVSEPGAPTSSTTGETTAPRHAGVPDETSTAQRTEDPEAAGEAQTPESRRPE